MKNKLSLPEICARGDYPASVVKTLLRLDQKRTGELESTSGTMTAFAQLAPLFGKRAEMDNARERRRRLFEARQSGQTFREIANAESVGVSMVKKLIRDHEVIDLGMNKSRF